MNKRILLIGTFDTKGEEYRYIRDQITARGHDVLLMNTGVLEESGIKADIPAQDVAEAGGRSLESLRNESDRGKAVDTMIAGVQKLVPELYEKGMFDGVLGLGGGAGTNIVTAGMRKLPVGVPKVMVSTLASGDVSSFVDVKDITMMYPVVDIAGLNRLSKQILANAAGAITGMVEVGQLTPEQEEKPLIAATMFGVTTPCVTRVRQKLGEKGNELVIFHATGTGGRAMEGLIEDGYFDAVADITTTEWCDQIAGGVLPAGENRLEAAGRHGIPQVVSCGALDMVNFHAIETVPKKFRSRNLYKHNPTVTLMRTNPDECREIGKAIAGKLNEARGPVVLMLPLKGVSAIDKEGEPFYDPKANEALFSSLREHIRSNVQMVELNHHINDPEFADAIADQLLEMLAELA